MTRDPRGYPNEPTHITGRSVLLITFTTGLGPTPFDERSKGVETSDEVTSLPGERRGLENKSRRGQVILILQGFRYVVHSRNIVLRSAQHEPFLRPRGVECSTVYENEYVNRRASQSADSQLAIKPSVIITHPRCRMPSRPYTFLVVLDNHGKCLLKWQVFR